ncbi:MAG: hypothetical protein QE263_00140 [Vampirovibrionales bacterium]|nr:hypothetical protein [Vampirovibrionales bacterium]
MVRSPLVALSGKQYAGKDQLADWLVTVLPNRFGLTAVKTPIAGAIKQQYAEKNRLSLQELETHKANHRSGLIELGNWGRQQSPDYWLERVLEAAQIVDGITIVSDMRLPREYEQLKASGALLIRLEADRGIRQARAERLNGLLTNEADPTECALDDIQVWDAVLTNNGTVDELAAIAEATLFPLLQARFSLQ